LGASRVLDRGQARGSFPLSGWTQQIRSSVRSDAPQRQESMGRERTKEHAWVQPPAPDLLSLAPSTVGRSNAILVIFDQPEKHGALQSQCQHERTVRQRVAKISTAPAFFGFAASVRPRAPSFAGARIASNKNAARRLRTISTHSSLTSLLAAHPSPGSIWSHRRNLQCGKPRSWPMARQQRSRARLAKLFPRHVHKVQREAEHAGRGMWSGVRSSQLPWFGTQEQ
jgi:hypothetical protein